MALWEKQAQKRLALDHLFQDTILLIAIEVSQKRRVAFYPLV
jgi:hypothetical protein